ncbi:MAG TPA: tRNA pseudouridine(38-40) synthase TruA [Nocardioidaceae bacterium]|nr:tRNA pseudouridine(38-40) synthase TruA [Nocardioidaceae bacterium]
MRLRIDLAYDGTEFHGWAIQPGLRTVQGDLEAALATVLRTPVQVTCAGRTDTGVHARGQVVHLDVEPSALAAAAVRGATPPEEALARRLNGVLASDVHVARAVEAPAGFDARFSAVWRRYAYRIADDPLAIDPLTRGHVLVWPRPLDSDAMNDAATHLLGEHDFAGFCKKREGATTIRTLLDLECRREGHGLLVTTVRADAFCHNMVRSLLGCLVAVGEGRFSADWAGEVLANAVRDPRVGVLAAHGLTLEEVGYPADAELAAQADAARTVRSLG